MVTEIYIYICTYVYFGIGIFGAPEQNGIKGNIIKASTLGYVSYVALLGYVKFMYDTGGRRRGILV